MYPLFIILSQICLRQSKTTEDLEEIPHCILFHLCVCVYRNYMSCTIKELPEAYAERTVIIYIK